MKFHRKKQAPPPEKVFCECHYPIRIKTGAYVNMHMFICKYAYVNV